jgi:hypothetical protein
MDRAVNPDRARRSGARHPRGKASAIRAWRRGTDFYITTRYNAGETHFHFVRIFTLRCDPVPRHTRQLSHLNLVPLRSHPLAFQLRSPSHRRPVAGTPEIVSRRIARDCVHRRDHARPSRTGSKYPAPGRAHGRVGCAAVRGARQSTCATVVHHRRQYRLRDGWRCLCKLDRRSVRRRCFGRLAGDLCHVRAAVCSPSVQVRLR